MVNVAIDEKKYMRAAILAEPGIEKYVRIRDMLGSLNVAESTDFQKAYNGFFRMRQRPKTFYDLYFRFMEERKGQSPSFEETLRYIYQKCNRVEASFSSKLVATIDPEQPIWDANVLANLGLKAPYYTVKNRIEKCIAVYEEIVLKTNEMKKSDEGKHMIGIFNQIYPDLEITDIKKIDFILWQMRD